MFTRPASRAASITAGMSVTRQAYSLPRNDARSRSSFGRCRSAASLATVPIQYLAPLPMQHAGVAVDVVVDGFEVVDAVRLARDVGVDRDRHDLGALAALAVEAVEGVDAPPGEVFRLVVLHQH